MNMISNLGRNQGVARYLNIITVFSENISKSIVEGTQNIYKGVGGLVTWSIPKVEERYYLIFKILKNDCF